MSDPHVELVMQGWERWNRGDMEGALELVHPDVEWRPGQLLLDVDEVYLGHEGVRRFWAEFMTPFESIAIEPLRHASEGDEVVINARFRARGRDGVTADVEVFQRYTVRDGKLAGFHAYPSWEAALAAAGLA
jgi:ketosteroid isomerase-like protein